MGGGILNNKAFTLTEVAACVVISVFISSVIIAGNLGRIQNARFIKTVAEMKSIAQASIDYLESQGSCPSDSSQLAPAFMPQAATSSPFGTGYQLSCTGHMVSVSNLIPAGIAQKDPEGPLLQISASGTQDNITVTETVPNAFVSRLLYDKQYLYRS